MGSSATRQGREVGTAQARHLAPEDARGTPIVLRNAWFTDQIPVRNDAPSISDRYPLLGAKSHDRHENEQWSLN